MTYLKNHKWAEVYTSDCKEILGSMESKSVDLVYLDPPFFTQKVHKLYTRDRSTQYSFNDVWESHQQYAHFIFERLNEIKRILASTGTVFFHCNVTSSHIVRGILDKVFGEENFRSEIIWYYKRWSNSKKSLLPTHQTIFFYSKTSDYKFNKIYDAYSSSTNVDQILQKRERDGSGKSIYAKDDLGELIASDPKIGVPLNDVWDIPFLNPKARERAGYPTQKPILLLERIISLCTEENDLVLDPFCGSGTTLVAAKLLNRNYIGIDISQEATELAKARLNTPTKSESGVLIKGRESYFQANKNALSLLEGLDFIPVHRNKGIDAFLNCKNRIVPIRIQRNSETLSEVAEKLYRSSISKNLKSMILVQTAEKDMFPPTISLPAGMYLVKITNLSIKEVLLKIESNRVEHVNEIEI